MTDGYSSQAILDLVLEQTKIVQRMSDIDIEIGNLPKMPQNLGSWMDSLPDLDAPASTRFKVSDLKKLSKLNKEYEKLKRKEEANGIKLRLALIENAISITNERLKAHDV